MASGKISTSAVKVVKNETITTDQYARVTFPANINLITAAVTISNAIYPMTHYLNPSDSRYYSKGYIYNTSVVNFTASTTYSITYSYL